MNTRRLLRMAEHLENVVALKPDRFDMRFWGNKRDCGTVCCALGHACTIPEFEDAGLLLTWDDELESAEVWFDGSKAYAAAMRFFGLVACDAEFVFSTADYPGSHDCNDITPLTVAARIRELIARHEPATACTAPGTAEGPCGSDPCRPGWEPAEQRATACRGFHGGVARPHHSRVVPSGVGIGALPPSWTGGDPVRVHGESQQCEA